MIFSGYYLYFKKQLGILTMKFLSNICIRFTIDQRDWMEVLKHVLCLQEKSVYRHNKNTTLIMIVKPIVFWSCYYKLTKNSISL